MATIRKRNDKFQVQVRIKGHSKSATFLTLKHARHWERQKELQLEDKVININFMYLYKIM